MSIRKNSTTPSNAFASPARMLRPQLQFGHIHQAARYREEDTPMDQIEAQGHQEARAGILYVELHSQRRGAVSNDGLGDS